LNDGVTNPDTSLSGEDFYRLYLDMTGKQEPLDLLIVVDASGSMSKTDMAVGTQTGLKRSAAITLFLNGSTSTKTDNGFLSYFLSLNSNNKVSVVNFYGDTSYTRSGRISSGYPGYTADSSVLQDWTSSNSFVNCAEHSNNGTNYEAGLKRATDQLSKVSEDGQRKVMVFLSDGVPTYFEIDQSDVSKYSSTTGVTSRNVGQRWGNGSYNSNNNYPYCKEPSKTAFDEFQAANPGVTVFTIGVSADINATSADGSQSPDVLKYMAEQGGGKFIGVTDNLAELKTKIESMFYPEDVVITDELSKYVRYYGDQPDVKVTMTEIATGKETVLWENEENKGVTEGGKAVFDKVVYTAADTSDSPTGSTGTVQAVFAEGYGLSPKYRYTLSFNVKTTQTAYTEYKNNGSSYAGVTGDKNTDYGTNTTSSEQPGFHSNTLANVQYKVADITYQELYVHPVVQVKVEMGPALPETGGAEIWYTIGGTLLVAGSLLYGCGRRRKRRRERRLH
jgi:LPXTG-motif cell wall-anchored protein